MFRRLSLMGDQALIQQDDVGAMRAKGTQCFRRALDSDYVVRFAKNRPQRRINLITIADNQKPRP